MKEKNINKIAVFFLFFNLFFCIFYMSIYESPVGSDSGQYDKLAMNLIEGKGYVLDRRPEVIENEELYDINLEVPTAWRPPGYPILLAGIYKVFGHDVQNVYVFQILALQLSLTLLFLIAKKVFGNLTSLISLGILSVWPFFPTFATQLMTETWALLLITIIVYILVCTKMSNWKWAVMGMLMGVLLYFRSNFVLFTPFLFLPFLKQKKIWKGMLLFFIMTTLVLTPWIVRNQQEFDSFIPLSTQAGEAIFFGTQPYISNETSEGQSEVTHPFYWEMRHKGWSESEENKYLMKQGINYTLHNPLEVLKTKTYAFGMSLFRPYPTERFDDPSYDTWVSQSILQNYISRDKVGFHIFKWTYIISFNIILFTFLLFTFVKHKKSNLLYFVGAYPLVMMLIFLPTSRLIIPTFPFMVICSVGYWVIKYEK